MSATSAILTEFSPLLDANVPIQSVRKQTAFTLNCSFTNSTGKGKERQMKACALCCLSMLLTSTAALKVAGNAVDVLDKRLPVHIGAVFPMSAGMGGWPGGEGCLPAATMALEDVNKLLPNVRLVMYWEDSQCQPGLGAKRLYELLYTLPTKVMLLSGCSLVTTVIGEAAPVWNLILLAYGASSPALSDRNRFPTLFRTHPSATIHNPTRIKLFKKFGWKKIAILQSVEEVFSSTEDDLEKSCEANNIQVISVQSFFGDPAPAVRSLKRQDARIIVGLFYEKEARKVFCEVYKQKLFSRRYIWFLIGWYPDDWYVPTSEDNINCTAEEMKEAAQYHFTTEALMHSQDETSGVSGMNSAEFVKRLSSKLQKPSNVTGGFPEAPLAYDAIWAAAFAINCTMDKLNKRNKTISEFNYEDVDTANDMLACMKQTMFRGVSGDVMFSEKGDRIALTQVEQLQGDNYIVMGYYDYRSDNLTWYNKEQFIGGKVPPDETIVQEQWICVSRTLYIIFCWIGIIGLACSLSCLVFNFCFHCRKIIRESYPQFNNIMLVGFIILMFSIFLFGLPVDGMSIPEGSFSSFCHAQVAIVMYGFSCSFGAMLSKVLMTHRLETMAIKNWEIQPWKFHAAIGFFLVIDTVLMTVWILSDPLQRSVEVFDIIELLEENVVLRPLMEHCKSQNQELWIGLIYSYKGISLCFGLFLAYESRKIKSKYVNDSRSVCLAIYNVAVLCFITAPVEIIILSRPDSSFSFFAITLLLCTFIAMGLIFIPKVRYVAKVPEHAEEQLISDVRCTAKERLNALGVENARLRGQVIDEERKRDDLRHYLEHKLLSDEDFGQLFDAKVLHRLNKWTMWNTEYKVFRKNDKIFS
uniref:G_PROTEIN_RECEP_F3_4 domain-containing protein n=1 Tax=Trichuris muris TaxID=70415 RepID=A0A5S6QQK2_TRIMR